MIKQNLILVMIQATFEKLFDKDDEAVSILTVGRRDNIIIEHSLINLNYSAVGNKSTPGVSTSTAASTKHV